MVSESELREIAERALASATGDTQVTVSWERGAIATGGGTRTEEAVTVEVTAARDGGLGQASTTSTDADALRRVVASAEAAAAASRDVSARLPDPREGRAHDSFDPALATLDPESVDLPPDTIWEGGAARVLIRSARGVDAFEQRSFARGTYDRRVEGRGVRLAAAAVRASDLDLAALHAEGSRIAEPPAEGQAPPGEHPVVLGPQAVADILDFLRWAFAGDGPLLPRAGSRIAASCISLSESPRYPSTLARSYDTEGVPRSPVPLVQDGVAHRVVWDTVSAAVHGEGAESTGHAGQAGRPLPFPHHLVLIGGGAADEAELARPIESGLLVSAIPSVEAAGVGALRGQAAGVFAIRGGEIAEPLADAQVDLLPLDILESAQALGARQRLVPTLGGARHVGATLAPALRAMRGLRVV